MAIKGRSGSRGRRRRGGAPRPVPVEVRRPLLVRRGFWIVALAVASATISVAVWTGAVRSLASSRAAELRGREAAVVDVVDGDLQAALAALQWVGEPDILALPAAFAGTLDAATDAPGIAVATAGADQFLSTLAGAQAALDAVDVTARVRDRGFGRLFVLRLIQARQRFVDALELYRIAATTVSQAASLEGDAQTVSIASARELVAQAAAALRDAYQNLVEAQVMAGTYQGPGQTPANQGR